MATPPKTPPKPAPRRVAAKKVVPPVKASAPVAEPKPVPAPVAKPVVTAPVAAAPKPVVPKAEPKPVPVVAKPTPVVAKAVAPKPVAPKAPAPAPKPMPFVIEPEAPSEPVAKIEPTPAPASEPAVSVTEAPKGISAPVAPIETKASTPSQPAAVAPMAAAMEPVADWQVPNALEGHYIMNEAIETGKKFAEDAKSRLQTMVSEFNEKAKVAMEKSSKTAEELSDLAKGNLEAVVESSKIAAKGFETLGQNAAEYSRASFEKTSATLKSFASVKSPTEFFQLHSELMTSAFDTMAAETAKTSEAVLKLAGEIAQPISNRVAIVSDKLKTLAA